MILTIKTPSTMIKTLTSQIYSDYLNSFMSIEDYAKSRGITTEQAKQLIDACLSINSNKE